MTGAPTSLDDLPPFAPPYLLGGSCLVAVGLWSGDAPPVPPGFAPIRVLGRPTAVVIANHYTEPPDALPIRYHEIIAATLARRGTTIVAAPFDMILDAPIPVELGQLHYGMPKRLDPTLRFDGLSVNADELALGARAHGPIAQALALPVRAAFALGVRVFTGAFDVAGVAHPPPRRARIALAPHGLGQSASIARCTWSERRLHALWCQAWDFASTDLGVPYPIEPGSPR